MPTSRKRTWRNGRQNSRYLKTDVIEEERGKLSEVVTLSSQAIITNENRPVIEYTKLR